MADLNPSDLSYVKQQDPRLHRVLTQIIDSVNNVAQQTNAAPVGKIPPPTSHSDLKVMGGAGLFDIAITDNSASYRGKEHFVDYSEDNFQSFHTLSLGPAKNARVSLGNKNLSFRSYAQYPTSGPSDHLYQGSIVSGGGSVEPPMQGGQGSGTGSSGYGEVPFTGAKLPSR